MLDLSDLEEVRLHQLCFQTLPLSVYEGTWTHSPPLVAMHLLDRSCMSVGNLLKLHVASPNSGIRARSMHRWYAWVKHKELWAIIVILLTTNVLFWFNGIVGWSVPYQPYMTTFMRPVPPTDMQLVLHKGGWRVSVSPTLVESNLTMAEPCWRLKKQTWRNIIVVLMCR